jgi:site-specific DNA-methyltransferase (adenine-specific)
LSADEDGQVSKEVRECFPETHARGNKIQKSFSGGEYNVDFGQGSGYEECGKPYDSGNASRFFKSIIYQAKASKSERNKGCEGLEEKEVYRQGHGNKENDDVTKRFRTNMRNNHPTVKPLALMEYLINMITPKGGTVLDPFMGSGTTGVACKNLNRNFIGIELDPEYFKIAERRV